MVIENADKALQYAQDNQTPDVQIIASFAFYQRNWALLQYTQSEKGEEERCLRAIGCALARNPNTPPAVLAKLVQHDIESIAQNPALPLLFVEDQNFLPDYALEEIVKHCFPSSSVLDILANHPSKEIAHNAQMHVNFAGEIGKDWREEAGKWVATLSSTPTEQFFLQKFQNSENTEHLKMPDWIWKHVEERPRKPLKAITKPSPLPATIPELYDAKSFQMIQKAKYKVRLDAVTTSQNAEFLQAMADDSNQNVRKRIAKNIYTSPETLYKLSRESDLKGNLLANASLPDDLLERLLEGAGNIANVVQYNPYVPYWALVSAWNQGVRTQKLRNLLLRNPETPLPIQYDAFFWQNGSEFVNFLRFCKNTKSQHHYEFRLVYNHPWWSRLADTLNSNIPKNMLPIFATKDTNRFVRAAAREQWDLYTKKTVT
jgi:hypothetical protein